MKSFCNEVGLHSTDSDRVLEGSVSPVLTEEFKLLSIAWMCSGLCATFNFLCVLLKL